MAYRQPKHRASPVQSGSGNCHYELDARLHRLAQNLPAAGLLLHDFLEQWHQQVGAPLRPADYLEFSVEDVIKRYGYKHMCIVQRASPASAGASATYIIPKPSKEQLEKAFRRTQAQLHAQGFPVTLGAVDRALAQAFGVGKLDELGCIPGELQAVQDLLFLEQNIHMYIITYLKARSVCTLADLEEYICQQFSTDNKKIESFNELGMGPLLKFDLVKANFRPPAHLVEVPQVSAVDVVEAIATAMEGNRDHKHKDDSKDRIDWSTVKQLMVEKHGVPFEDLCVRLPYSMGPFITGLVSQWKGEQANLRSGLKTKFSRQKTSLHKVVQIAQGELKEIGRQLLLQHAAAMQQQTATARSDMQQTAQGLLQQALADETTALQTGLMLQPLSFEQLQAALAALQDHCAQQSTFIRTPMQLTASDRVAEAVRRISAAPQEPAVTTFDLGAPALKGLRRQDRVLLHRACVAQQKQQQRQKESPPADCNSSSSVPAPSVTAAADMSSKLATSILSSLHKKKLSAILQLYNNDHEQLAAVLHPMLPRGVVLQLCGAADVAAQDAEAANVTSPQPPPPPFVVIPPEHWPTPPPAVAGSSPASAVEAHTSSGPGSSSRGIGVFVAASAAAPTEHVGSQPPATRASTQTALVFGGTSPSAQVLSPASHSDAALPASTAAIQPNPAAGAVQEEVAALRPDELCEMMWKLLDVLHEHMSRQMGNNVTDDYEQQVDDHRWWRQAPIAVFSADEGEAQEQLQIVSTAAEQVVRGLAGPSVQDPRLITAVANYWKQDALLQLLLHAVRLLMQLGPAMSGATAHGVEQQQKQPGTPEAATEEQQQDETASAAVRTVGLPELLTAMQELGKGVAINSLWQLEQGLLNQLELPSLDLVQLPGGCNTLLSILAQHSELAAALSGHPDALDVGPVTYEEVTTVVSQALRNLQHSAQARRCLSTDGRSQQCSAIPTRSLLSAMSGLHGAISTVLCTHFQVPHELRLGYGPVQNLIKAARDRDTTASLGGADSRPYGASSSSAAGVWAALALTPSGTSDFTAHASGLKPHHALVCLSAAPLMSDLATWSDWESLYAPLFGPLKRFLLKHSVDDLGFQFLELPGGKLLKLPPASLGSDLQKLRAGCGEAVQQDAPELLVSLLICRVASQGGFSAAHDLKMLGDILGSIMTAAMSRQQGNTAAISTSRYAANTWAQSTNMSAAAGLAATAISNSHQESMTADSATRILHAYSPAGQRLLLFILECLQLLPVPLAAALAQEVLLRPLAEALGKDHETVSKSLLAAAVAGGVSIAHISGHTAAKECRRAAGTAVLRSFKGPGARQRLHVLGYMLGVAAWQDDCKQQQKQQVQTAAVLANSTQQVVQQIQQQPADSMHMLPGVATPAGQQAPESQRSTADQQSEGLPVMQPADLAEFTPQADVLQANVQASTGAAQTGLGSSSSKVGDSLLPVDGACIPAKDSATAEAPASAEAEGQPVITAAATAAHIGSATAAGSAEMTAASTATSDPCHQLIERIRRLKGVGVVMEGEAAEAFQATQRTLGNAVEKLSKELYSKDVHFVLELVQNADDNKYSSGVPCPMLELVMTAGAVTVANNELGFNEQDVMSLSDIGESKKKGEAGYTGQKGIGFKSVFRITDQPHIFSNGFRFNYDLITHGKLGYVMPTWQQQLQDEFLQALQCSTLLRLSQQNSSSADGPTVTRDSSSTLSHSRAGSGKLDVLLGPGGNLTAMHLSLKAGCDEVGQKVSQLRPTLLLFLRKLRCLMLTDAEQGESKLMMRVQEKGNTDVVRLLVRTVSIPPQQQSSTQLPPASRSGDDGDIEQLLLEATSAGDVLQEEESRWLVVSDTFYPGDIRRLHYEVQETKVSLAFGIFEQQPSPQEVFAFLPVRRYGLNFMVQGDFVVPSSRQDVDLDDPFNQLLRSRVPGLFASSFNKFKALPPPTGESQLFWIDWWLRCVPLPEHMHEFFANLPSEIAGHLMTLPCIPTEAEDGSMGPLVLPGQALICNNPAIRQLVSAEQLARLQGKFFVHPDVTVLFESRELRRLLGVREFDPQEVISLIKDLAVAGELPSNNIPELRQLLACVFGLLFAPSSQQQHHWGAGSGTPGGVSTAATAAASSSSIRVQLLLRKLRQVPLLPVYGRPGVLVAAQGGMLSSSSSSDSNVGSVTGAVSSTVYLPLELNSSDPAAAAAPMRAATPTKTPSRLSRTPATPGRPPATPVSAATNIGDVSTAAVTAAAALAACNITQEQLAGLPADKAVAAGAGSEGDHGPGVGQLLFVDCELLQLHDQEALGYMLRGLKELGVRELEPLDVVHGYVLPQLAHHARQLRATAAAPDSTVAATAAAELSAAHQALSTANQQHLMRLLAFPLAAGLLDVDLRKDEAAVTAGQQQQQQDEHSSDDEEVHQVTSSNRPSIEHARRSLFSSGSTSSRSKRPQSGYKSLLSQLAEVAVVVTSSGIARLATGNSSSSSAQHGDSAAAAEASDTNLYLPKQLGNELDLPQVFPAYPWNLVSPDYASCCSPVTPAQWSALFTALGVQQFIPIQQRTLELTWQQLLIDPTYVAWKAAAEQANNNVRYILHDWHWPAFEDLLAGIRAAESAQQQQQLRALCSVVSELWTDMKQQGQLEAKYSINMASPAAKRPPSGSSSSSNSRSAASQSKQTSLSAAAASWRPGSSSLPSSLLLQLQQSCWMLASDGQPHRPSELFANLQTIKRLFKQQVLYVTCEVSRDMLLKLGATADIRLEVVLGVLADWSNSSSSSSSNSGHGSSSTDQDPAAAAHAGAPAAVRKDHDNSKTGPSSDGFVTTLADMSRIYEHLEAVVGDAELPADGFDTLGTWQQQQEQAKQDGSTDASIPKDVLMRLTACKACSEQPLIWLPDVDAVRSAAEAAARAADDQGYDDMMGYGYAGTAAAAGGGGGGRSRVHVGHSARGRTGHLQQHSSRAAAAASAASVHVPDDVMYDVSVIADIQNFPMRGRFYKPEQLRFTDDPGILEVTYHSLLSAQSNSSSGLDSSEGTKESAAAPPPVLRVVGVYYKRHQRLFVEQLQRFRYNRWIPLVGLRPTFGDHLRVLEAVITTLADKATPDSQAYKMVMKVFVAWSDAIARGAINPATQDRLVQELAGFVSGKQWQVFPGTDGTWASLTDGLLLPDDSILAQLFSGLPGITFLNIPQETYIDLTPPASAAMPSRYGSQRASNRDSPSRSLAPLLTILGIRRLTEVIQKGSPMVEPEQPEPGRQLTACLAAALPLLQRHVAGQLSSKQYKMIDSVLASKLQRFKVLAVDSLAKVHLLPVTNSLTATAEGVVSRDGGTWVERQEPCGALVVMGRGAEPAAGQSDDAAQRTEPIAAADDSAEEAAAGQVDEGAAGQVKTQDTEPVCDNNQQSDPAAAAEGEDLQQSSGTADVLYVVQPDELIECCGKVADQFSSYVADLAAVAGCVVDQQAMTQLVDRLLMVQATGGDVSQVMRQPEYSRYPQLPESAQPWQIPVPPEPKVPEEPEESPAAEAAAADAENGVASSAEGYVVSFTGVLPASLELSGLLEEDEHEEATGVSTTIHQKRLDAEAKIKARMEAAAAARAAAAAEGSAPTAPLAAQGNSGGSAAAQAAGSAGSAGKGLVRDPLLVSSELFPAVLPVAPGPAAAAVVSGQGQLHAEVPTAAASTSAAAAAASYQQGVVVVAAGGAGKGQSGNGAADSDVADGAAAAAVDQQVVTSQPPAVAEAFVAAGPGPKADPAAAAAGPALIDSHVSQAPDVTDAVLPSNSLATAATAAADAAPAAGVAVVSADSSKRSELSKILWDVPTFSVLGFPRPLNSSSSVITAGSGMVSRKEGHPVLQQSPSQAFESANNDDLDVLLGLCGVEPSMGSPGNTPAAAALTSALAVGDGRLRYLEVPGRTTTSSSSSSIVQGAGGNSTAKVGHYQTSAGACPHRTHAIDGTHSRTAQQQQGDNSTRCTPGMYPRFPSWQEAESAARLAGFISDRVPVPHQLLTQVSAELPPAPEQPQGAAATADAAAVGRYGEELVYRYYQQHPELQQDMGTDALKQFTVEWVNRDSETALPYDMVVYELAVGSTQQQQQQGEEPARSILAYLEVKASRDAQKQLFELSQRELQFAAEQGDRYHILRVTGVGGSPSLERLVDPVKLWSEKVIRLCVVL